MKNSTLRCAMLLASASAFAGCSSDTSNAPDRAVLLPAVHSALLDAPGLVSQAVSGVSTRGEQDEMLKVENQLPGFGGFFFDSTDNLTVFMKPSAGIANAALRIGLANAYANRPEATIRARMAGSATARVIRGDYSLSELIAVENRIAHPRFRLPGFVGVGVSLSQNRVKVGFEDSASLLQSVSLIARMGVPTPALISEIWGHPTLALTFQDKVRPTFGGVSISMMNRTTSPWDNVRYPWGPGGSLGYDVHTPSGVHYMLISSHVANQMRGVNGALGDTVLQNGINLPLTLSPIYPAATIAVNPPWNTGAACPVVDSTTMQHFDFCTAGDAVLAQYLPGVTWTRGVGVSTIAGAHGAAGSLDVRQAWQIADVWPPEMVRSGIDGVHKSASHSGTTTGLLDLSVTQDDVLICMDPWDRTEENMAPHGCLTGIKLMRLTNQVKVSTALTISGDSGGPVFAGNGNPYHALGVVVGGNGGFHGEQCAGDTCYFWFSRWSEIEARLGQGSLNPITSQ